MYLDAICLVMFVFELLLNTDISKLGVKVSATLEGFYFEKTLYHNSHIYPVVSFITNDGEKVFTKLRNSNFSPLCKVGKTFIIKYMKTSDEDIVIPCECYISNRKNEKFNLSIHTNYRGILFDFKYFVFLLFNVIIMLFLLLLLFRLPIILF